MATAVKRLSFHARRCQCRIQCRTEAAIRPQWLRPFSSTITRFADEEAGKVKEDNKPTRAQEMARRESSMFDPDDQRYYEYATPEERGEMDDIARAMGGRFDERTFLARFGRDLDDLVEDAEREFPDTYIPPEREAPGYFNMGEERDEVGEDEEFENDDISSLAHGELEQHREFREYARLAAWEMPLLSKLAKPYEPPGQDQPLRFRYTTYMGEQHPAGRKVVVEFTPSDMPDLTPQQREKLIKLAGVRYNPSTEIVKMSCESFETQAQNKRYLADLVTSLLKEARDGTDTFDDVPFDFRHHKPKPRFEFPEAWNLTPERRQQLQEKRQLRLRRDEQRALKGTLVNGAEVIGKALLMSAVRQEVPVMVEAGARAKQLPGGKQQTQKQKARR